MARHRRYFAPLPPARPDPLLRIAELAGHAMPLERMRREVEAILAGFLADGAEPAPHAALSGLRERLARHIATAQEALAELDRDDQAAGRRARATVAALQAAQAAIAGTRGGP